uniref:PyrK3 n=1 Tax=Streptomyces rugosporus TaxID=295838 RepID=K7QRK4_STRRG|nr:PyrK3 [Streptomyces rugosporus]
MRTPGIYLSGVGAYLPESVSVQEALARGLCSPDTAAALEEQGWTGTSIAGDVPAPEMALHAGREAVAQWGGDPADLDLLLYADVWHQGPDGWVPQLYLQHHLTGGNPLAMEVRQGCTSVIGALNLAAGYLMGKGAGGSRSALVVSADNFGTPMVDRWGAGRDWNSGDGAAAGVLSTEPGFAELLAINATAIPQAEEMHRCGEPMFPPTVTLGRTLDFGARMEAYHRKLFAEGVAEDFTLTLYQRSKACVENTLEEAGVPLDKVRHIIINNCSRQDTDVQFLGMFRLPLAKTTWEFGRTIGHVGAADHLLSLHHLLTNGKLAPGDHVLVVGMAPGITYGCAVLTVHDTGTAG